MIEAATGISSELQLRETSFQIVYRGPVQFKELLAAAEPAVRVVGLIPYFPMSDVEMKAAGPAFIVMPDDMFADPGPFKRIGRG